MQSPRHDTEQSGGTVPASDDRFPAQPDQRVGDTDGANPASQAPRTHQLIEAFERWQFAIVVVLLVVATLGWVADIQLLIDVGLFTATVVALVPATIESLRQLVHREATADVVAVLAMLGALVLDEWLAGAIIALMLTGGEALEERAVGRARAELTSLLRRAPRVAHRKIAANATSAPAGSQPADGAHDLIEEVDVDDLQIGDVVVVKGGQVVPVDGLLLSDKALLDEAALTGESVPVELTAGQMVRSGVVNAGGPMEVRATAPASASTYAGIVRLVEQASTERAKFVRVADRFAGWFLVVTIVLAVGAWLASGDPVRALAVLVVATPCPLILAAPAAIVGGVSAAARRGIIVKGGPALESLATGRIVLLDKTGTITSGRPRVAAVHPEPGFEAGEVLRLAAAADQVSVHPFAPAIVEAAHRRGVAPLPLPSDVSEQVGAGLAGVVDGRSVRVGQLDWVRQGTPVGRGLRGVRRRAGIEGRSVVYVAIDGALAGAITLHDPVRPETPRAIASLRRAGIEQVVMVTGDRTEIAELVADAIGADRVLAERTPEEKVEAVTEASGSGRVIMVGDGINDAPALAKADTGVAMGARGASAASEAADVVLTSDRLDGLADAVIIARRTRRIAWQSAVAGIGMSAVAMVFAALGYLTPVAGAIVQEVIDLAVLANALRALRFLSWRRRRRPVIDGSLAPMWAEHRRLTQQIDELTIVAETLEEFADTRAEPNVVIQELARIRTWLADELLVHELAEEEVLYPLFRQAFEGEDPTVALVRSHRELARRIRLFARMVEEIDTDDGPDASEVLDLQRALFGLHALLEFHVALEDELYAAVERSDQRDATGSEEQVAVSVR